ncbi:MAG: hypothetical protein IPO58_15735 [Betaproteobacteria bacterium]|nr:hypothetical protein [Betaproteobacteria bacterium]
MPSTDSSVSLRCVAVGTTALLLAGLPWPRLGNLQYKATPQLKADTVTMPDSKNRSGPSTRMLRAGTPGN